MARTSRRTPDDDTAATGPKDNAFITKALTQWRTADTAEGGGAGSMRYEGLLDQKFLNLQQWDENDERDRLAANKPTLVIDQIGEPYRQLTGQLRRARPAIQINPVDNGADIDTAEVFQGLYRHIEVTGGAKPARDEAAKGMCGPGWGYYRVITEFEYDNADPTRQPGPELFDQCIKYQPIENQFTVFRDPSCPLHEPWKARFTLVIENVPTDTVKEKWPHAKVTSQEAFAATGVSTPEWFPEGSVRVADYFYVEETDGLPIALLADGRAVPLELAPPNVAILQKRTPKIRKVKLAKITGAEILEGNDDLTAGRDFPSDYIPVIPMYGESLVVDGKRTLRGIVRAARDPQRMYNYQNSELVYELALAPKSKVIMAEGQDEGYEQMWEQAPVKAFPALKYKPTSLLGQPVAPPSIAQFTDATKIQALTVAINQHKADLRSTTGWYDATDPGRKNTDQSGKAILARKEAQSEGSVNYTENFGNALHYEAMVVMSMIPRIYNRTGRILRIVGLEDDTKTEEVTVGQPRKGKQKQQRGVQGIFAWGAGRYDVTISIGASYSTRRQEAAEVQLELMKVLPPPMAAAMAPSAVANMDWPGAREVSERLKRALPPELQDNDEQDEDDPELLKQQLMAAEQKSQEMMQVIQQLQEAVKTDQVKAEADLQKTQMSAQADAQQAQQSDAVKLEIARMDNETKIAIEERKLQAEFALAQMKIDADLEKARIAAEAAAQARREGFAHDDVSGERGHQHRMDEAHSAGGDEASA